MGTPWDARTYDATSQPQQEWAQDVIERLRAIAPDAVVLDVGCGTGRVTERLLKLVPRGRVLAIGASRDMVELARRRLGQRATVWQESALDLNLATTVDAIFSTATLHWVPDHDRLWGVLAGALRAGGRLEVQCGGEGNIARVREAIEVAVSDGFPERRMGALGVRLALGHRVPAERGGLQGDPLLAVRASHLARRRRCVCAHFDPRRAPGAPGPRATRRLRRSGPGARQGSARLRAAQRLSHAPLTLIEDGTSDAPARTRWLQRPAVRMRL